MAPGGIRERLVGLLKRAAVDRAIAYGLLARIWQGAAGLVSLALIAWAFSPALQGYYYAFFSLLALQSFFEVGLYLVIVSFTSHEWAHLHLAKDGRPQGDAFHLSRLASLFRFVVKWYLAASIVFIAVTWAVGFAFFSTRAQGAAVAWQWPWSLVVILTGMALFISPFLSFLEGCNQVLEINRIRLYQGIASAVGFWILVIAGAQLWAMAAPLAMSIVFGVYFLAVRYRPFFGALLVNSQGDGVRWLRDIWPMQWKLAVQGVAAYISYFSISPIIFHYHGANAAGQIGMTLQIVFALQLLAQSWLQARAPTFGMLAARRDYSQLDAVFRRTTLASSAFLVGVATLTWLAIVALHGVGSPYAQRVLEPASTALLLLYALNMHLVQCFAAYLRAHRREVLLYVGVGAGLLSGILIWWWGSAEGTYGAALALFAVTAFFSLPVTAFIWRQSRISWHARGS